MPQGTPPSLTTLQGALLLFIEGEIEGHGVQSHKTRIFFFLSQAGTGGWTQLSLNSWYEIILKFFL